MPLLSRSRPLLRRLNTRIMRLTKPKHFKLHRTADPKLFRSAYASYFGLVPEHID